MKKPNQNLSFKCAPVALACALVCQGVWSQTDIGTVRIAGEGELGTGMMIDEDGAKSKSTITKEAIDKQRPTTNPFQLLNMLPGVNASSYDATGLFGGNMRVRGFNSDQMGLTINGAPVNDSGNFAVYPQEYTDSENLCEVFITQGSADTDAPHVGASGGNIGLVSCGPKDQFGGKYAQSVGGLHFNKVFLRLDSGLFGQDNPSKTFISYSNSSVDKFKGYGGAKRDHIDWGWDSKISRDTSFTANLLYNRAINNNFLTLTKNEFYNNPSLDFTNVIPQHSTTTPMVDSGTSNFGTNSVGSTARTKLAYYGYSLNPFENALFTSRLKTRVDEHLTLSLEPYYWYGYGTGGTQQTTLTEATSSFNGAAIKGGIANIPNSGAGLGDNVGIYRGSVTETHRPGFTFKAAYDIEDHKILAGYWYERANHRQTQPGTTLGNDGSITDLWLKTGLLTYNNGDLYEGRNYRTISTGSSAFISDTYTQGRLDIIPGVRYTSIQRNFTNYASSGTGLGADYTAQATYSKALPSIGLRYRLDDTTQIFGNITENMRAPSNFVQAGWVSGGTISNGVLTGYTIKPNTSIQAETATNTEIGMRFNQENYKASFAFFNVDFKNRIAQGYNPDTATYTDYNMGNSNMKGFEAEIGTKPIKGWSFYGSATYTVSKILNDFAATSTSSLPTNGAIFPDTPRIMWAASAQYTSGPWLAMLTAKYTGKRYTTLVNDEYLDAYTVYDFNAGYKFESSNLFKNPTLRMSVSNLFNKSYLIANSGSGSNITTSVNAPSSQGGGLPTYYVGAPRFTSFTFSADF